MDHTRSIRDSDDDGDDEGEDYYEYEDSDQSYAEEDADTPTVPCPYCRHEIHEDAQRCPYCERYISAEDSPGQRRPWWVLVGVAICLYIVFSWFF